ncbi:MAG: hypothetical protein LLF92_02205 [Planctomycetaceae bacterium]|nr:hypothetical protein [Planctomycetaceae bacterium]
MRHKLQLAGIYDIAKEYEKGLELTWQSLSEKQTPTIYIDLIDRLLRRKSDAVKVREIIGQIDESSMMDVMKPFYIRCRGILAYLEGDYNLANDELHKSLITFEKIQNSPLIEGETNITKAYYCCVLAKSGNLTEAKKYFAQAKNYLIAAGESNLMNECVNAMK